MVQNIALKRSSDTVFQLEITPHVFFPHPKGQEVAPAQAARQTILFRKTGHCHRGQTKSHLFSSTSAP